MPLRKEHRKYYGRAWHEFRLQLITAAGGQICNQCKVELAQGINGAHTDHNPRNKYSVVLLCPSCHATHDAPHRIAIMRRRKAKITGQAWLLPELEWAPFADWEIPGWVFDRLAQLRLFDTQ
jgi:RNase P subunit RPR2